MTFKKFGFNFLAYYYMVFKWLYKSFDVITSKLEHYFYKSVKIFLIWVKKPKL